MLHESSGCCLPMLAMALAAVFPSMPAAAAGQALGVKHPVLDHKLDPARAAEYEAGVQRVMAMGEAEMLAFVPDKPYMYFCHCPSCHGGVEGFYMYDWSIERPAEIKCKFCGTVYPNEKFPMDQTMVGKNALGETVAYRYYHEEKTGMNYMFSDHVNLYRRTWIIDQCNALGRAYYATKKPEYARRAVLILDRLTQVYPHYPVMQQWITQFEFAKSQQPPYPNNGGKWGRWCYEEIGQDAIEAYDLVCESDEFDKLSAIRGYDVREKLEKEFYQVRFDYLNTFPDHASNMAPGAELRPAIRLGKVINAPRYVHWAYRWLLEILVGRCYYDGMWHEAPSYHYQTMGGLATAFLEMKGYSDPAGYIDEKDGKRFDSLDPDKDIIFFTKAKDAPAVIGFPNGNVCPVHDTWANQKVAAARTQTVSTICPGYGHASLGRGRDADQMQAQLHFSAANGHCHLDNLNLTLFAKGREVLSDVGYTWTQGRHWTVCTAGHNTVTVDRTDQQYRNSDGDLLWFFPDAGGVAVVEADGKRGYANIKDLALYRRLLVLIPVSETDAYVVDVFRVRGGAVHDWMLHGDADQDSTATCSLKLTPRAGDGALLEPSEKWVEPVTEGSGFIPYGVIRKVSEGHTTDSVVTEFRYLDQPDRGVRIHLLSDGETQVFLGQSPSIRRSGVGAGGDYRKTFNFWMPHLVARRTASPAGQVLSSVFTAVEEPFAGTTFIAKVELLALTPPADGAVAIRVTHGETVDTIISTLDEPPYPERATPDGTRIKGRLGIIRRAAGRAASAWLFEGETIAVGEFGVTTSPARLAGQIVAATRQADGGDQDAFIVDTQLPEGGALHGVWMVVTHGNGIRHGYEIERVEKRDGGTRVVLTSDHGLIISGDKTREAFFPRRECAGVNSFVIPLAATVVGGD